VTPPVLLELKILSCGSSAIAFSSDRGAQLNQTSAAPSAFYNRDLGLNASEAAVLLIDVSAVLREAALDLN
jgi:hypothetical protein